MMLSSNCKPPATSLCVNAAQQCGRRNLVARSRHASARTGNAGQGRLSSTLSESVATSSIPAADAGAAKSDEYSHSMQQQMGGTLEYRHEDGMNFAHVLDNVMVGSCLQTSEDVDRLADAEGVGAVLCLQEDSDMAWFNLDVTPIEARCRDRGDIQHIRYRIRDFDPFDLRMKLPAAVQIVADQAAQGRRVYIHCTAGMGRAPATALAYMSWCRGMSLAEAHACLTAVRACNPRLVAIRQAACDLLLDGGACTKVKLGVSRVGISQRIQIAGLDVGWGQRIDLEREAGTGRFVTERTLPAGKFPYKLVFDETLWTCSADHPTMLDGEHLNNFVEVVGNTSATAVEARLRLMSADGTFTTGERHTLQELFAAGRSRAV